MDKVYVQKIKNVLQELMGQLNIPYHIPSFDHALHAACRRAAKDRGICLEGPVTIASYIPLGVVLASTAYAHLTDHETRVYIALYTSALVAVEDVCSHDFDLLKAFCHRFIRGRPHGHPILDCYDLILRELPDYFDLVVADMMLQSNMDFVVALVLEYEMQYKPMSPSARGFPVFLRNLSGAAKIYSMLAFPREIPLRSYVEVIPAEMTFVNFINDIFSFYKEELVHESVNCISNIARCSGRSKLQVLRDLADESVEAHKEILAVLSQSPEALKAFQHFCTGYVYFHTSSPRYKVSDLWSFGSEGMVL
ncbi:hypothetical protein AX17_002016 [Amanita inopinata Kibby_2008]|nr:hypothetical protein AX17_002016 [Amanita inopinata Kibby_2008]